MINIKEIKTQEITLENFEEKLIEQIEDKFLLKIKTEQTFVEIKNFIHQYVLSFCRGLVEKNLINYSFEKSMCDFLYNICTRNLEIR